MVTETAKPRLRKLATLAAALLALASATYLLLRPEPGFEGTGPREKVTIAHSTLPYAALAQIAQVKGFFQQEGLDVTPQLHAYGKLALKTVIEGRADFATVAETPVMLAIMNGAPLSILATIQVSKKSHAIVARKDQGILSPEDLKGRRIGTTLGTSADFFLDVFLVTKDISRKDIQVVNLQPHELADALARGDIDAVSAWAPFLMQTQKKAGDRGITFHDSNIYTQTFNIVSTRDYSRKHPETLKKILLALLEAERFAKKNPLEAQRLVADFSGMDIETLREIWGLNTFSLALDQSLLLALEDESRWALKSGLTRMKAIPDYLDFLELEGLQSVKPGAVKVFR